MDKLDISLRQRRMFLQGMSYTMFEGLLALARCLNLEIRMFAPPLHSGHIHMHRRLLNTRSRDTADRTHHWMKSCLQGIRYTEMNQNG